PTAKQSIPEVIDYTRLFKQPGIMKLGEKKFREESGFLADPSVIKTFDIQMIQGDRNSLSLPQSIVLSRAMAQKYFGNSDALNKPIEFEHETYIVKGIFQDYPANSHLKFDYLLRYPDKGMMQDSWRWRNFYTYLKINPDADITGVKRKLEELLAIRNNAFYKQENRRDAVLLQSLADIHLYSHLDKEVEANGNATSLLFLLIVGLFVMIMSWLNYINLTITDTSYRHKEIGVRKVLGSSKGQLTWQFFTESFIQNLIALLLAMMIVTFLYPYFQDLSGMSHNILRWTYKGFLQLMLPVIMTGILVTGIYPAVIISWIKPVNIIKGVAPTGKQSFTLRNAFIVFQFFLATALISGVIVVYKQLSYMTSRYPGFNQEQILIVRSSGGNDSLPYIESFRNEILSSPLITSVSGSAFVPGQEITRVRGIKRKSDNAPSYYTFANTTIDYEFTSLFNLKFLAGRNFSKDFPSDNKAVLLNEEAVIVLGFKNIGEALNKEIINGDRNPDTLKIIGVLANFHQRSVQFPHAPIVFLPGNNANGFYSIKIKTTDMQPALSFIENTYSRYFAESPFDFFFLDNYFNRQYQKDKQFGTVFGVFTIIAIWLSCMGLFAMVRFLVGRRTKEMGIRKILGATALNIVSLIYRDYLKLLAISILIATPFSWWIMHTWLQNYATRIQLSWWVFFYAGVVTSVVALVTVSLQAIKASVMNPVHSIKTE
ncbi:MAG TPA: FtsX-like permease family protein, partial [Flavitalea sp.]|nr:FtsX-like permease family protein [Flavitalea sp.]